MKTLLAIVTLTVIALSLITITQPSYSQVTVRNRVLIILAPGLNIKELFSMNATLTNTTGFNFTSIIINSTRLQVEPSPPYDQLYYKYLLVTGSKNGFEQLYLNKSIMDQPWLAINHDWLPELWDPNSTVFANSILVDPVKYGSAINPKYNFSGFYIPPITLTVKINDSVKWEILNITINLTASNGIYRVTLNGSSLDKPVRDIRFVNNVTDRFLINITKRVMYENYVVEPGLYRLKIRLVNVSETHATIFIPGVRSSDHWISSSLGIYDKPVYVVSEEIFNISQRISGDTSKWLLNEIIGFYKDLFTIAARKPQVSLIIYSYDLLINSFIAFNNEFRDRAVLALGEIIVDAVRRDYNVILYVPYLLEHRDESLFIDQDLEVVVPGLLHVKNEESKVNLFNLLLNNTFNDLKFLEFSNETYALVSYGDVPINKILIKPGALLIYPSQRIAGEHVLSTDNVIGYLLAFSRSYGLGLSDVLKNLSTLNHELARANSMIANLNQTISDLNETINSLKKKLGDAEAETQLLKNQVSDLNSTINTYVKREKEMKLFLVAGFISVVILNILLYALGSRMLKKER